VAAEKPAKEVLVVILIGGGSRSGKTRFALDRARQFGDRLAYVATAELRDEEMAARAAMHRAERGDRFTTIEEPRDLAGILRDRSAGFDALVIDCLTLWISNLLEDRVADLNAAAADVAEAADSAAAAVIFVTSEVGCGIVPDNELARRFRDHAGWVNQSFAARAAEVYWMAFGCALKVKG
jgi:adenosylcobinamide kinase/adenosylcobinamide-phosphate guanylyltransferase